MICVLKVKKKDTKIRHPTLESKRAQLEGILYLF